MSDNISIKMALLSLYGLIQAAQKQPKPRGRRTSLEEEIGDEKAEPDPNLLAEKAKEEIKEEVLLLLPETLPKQPVVKPEMITESEVEPKGAELIVENQLASEDIWSQSESWEDLWKEDGKHPALLWDDRLWK